jgi:outer membrane lipoprotein-sorting protein
VAIDQSADYLDLTLQDETPAGTVRIALIFDKTTQELVQWVLTSPDGSELTFSLYDVEKDVEIPASYFYLNINDYNKVDAPD